MSRLARVGLFALVVLALITGGLAGRDLLREWGERSLASRQRAAELAGLRAERDTLLAATARLAADTLERQRWEDSLAAARRADTARTAAAERRARAALATVDALRDSLAHAAEPAADDATGWQRRARSEMAAAADLRGIVRDDSLTIAGQQRELGRLTQERDSARAERDRWQRKALALAANADTLRTYERCTRLPLIGRLPSLKVGPSASVILAEDRRVHTGVGVSATLVLGRCSDA